MSSKSTSIDGGESTEYTIGPTCKGAGRSGRVKAGCSSVHESAEPARQYISTIAPERRSRTWPVALPIGVATQSLTESSVDLYSLQVPCTFEPAPIATCTVLLDGEPGSRARMPASRYCGGGGFAVFPGSRTVR